MRRALLSTIVLALALSAGASAQAELRVLDKPLWLFPGEQFRICLEQPAGSGKLDVQAPPTLELFDAWDQDAVQRFYFRSKRPGDATIRFSGKGGQLEMKLEVLAWGDLYQRRQYKSVELPRLWPTADLEYSELKTRRTLHTEGDLDRLRAAGGASHRAKRWLATSDEELFHLIPGPCVPRTCLIVLGGVEGGGIGKGCPVCGIKVYKGRSGFYPWVFDPIGHPWKVQCPECKTWFPSNDWRKGDMHSGPFPDDGYGCEPATPVKDANGRPWRWPFIAYYHQWAAYMDEFTPGVIECARASVATGDKAYAHKAAIGLLRFAEAMADMAVNLNHRKLPNRDGVYQWPVGAPIERYFERLSGSFSYIQPNWDTPRMEECARSWDLVFDQLADDAGLLEFCRSHHHGEIRTYDQFRRFIEAGVLRAPLQMCLDNAVARNYPMQETCAGTLALGLGTPKTMEVVDWLLNENGIRFALANQYYKDGSAHESPSYNHIQIRDMNRLFETLDCFRRLHPDLYAPPRFVSPMQDPKFRLLYDFPLDFSLIGRTYAAVGDTGGPARPGPLKPGQGYPCSTSDWINAYRATKDRRFLQAMYGPDGAGLESVPDTQLRSAAQQTGQELGWQVKLRSNILDGYGHAILRSGEGDHQRALWVRYKRCLQHAHPDMLTYGLEGLQRSLLPELGYPEGWTYAGHWETNWGTHYGTKITGVRSTDFNRGELTTFAGQPPVQLAVAESRAKQNGRPVIRQRLIALVDLSEQDFYALTVERVEAGQEQTFSFHGPDGEATPENVRLQPFEGTALGEGLKYGDFSSAKDSELSCLAFLREPARAEAHGVWSLDYLLRDQENVHLRMTSVSPGAGTLIVAKGGAPGGGRSEYDMTWAVLKTQGERPLTRQYLQVLQPYVGSPVVRKVERLPVTGDALAGPFEPLAVRVTTEKFVDTVLLQHRHGAVVTADGIRFDGEFGLWRERDGELLAAVLVRGAQLIKDGKGLTLESPEYKGRIAACDWMHNAITVKPAPPAPATLAGRHVRLTNEHGSSASYQIETAEADADGCRITFRYDPRLGEGFVQECRDGVLVSATQLKLSAFDYYAGKTLANETGEAFYTLSNVADGRDCVIAKINRQDRSAAKLNADFADRDGDGLRRFVVYDYGPGDSVTMENVGVTGGNAGRPQPQWRGAAAAQRSREQ